MTTKSAFALLFLSLATATGCSQTMNKLDPEHVHIKRNPHPQERYELTFTIHDAPGTFDSVTGEISYLIANDDCIPSQPISGGNPGPALNDPIILTSVHPEFYKGYIYLDVPIDENYFGLGVCHWVANGVYLTLKHHGVVFTGGITKKDIEANKTVSTFFLKSSFSGPPGNAPGVDELSIDPAAKSDSTQYFSVTVTARKLLP